MLPGDAGESEERWVHRIIAASVPEVRIFFSPSKTDQQRAAAKASRRQPRRRPLSANYTPRNIQDGRRAVPIACQIWVIYVADVNFSGFTWPRGRGIRVFGRGNAHIPEGNASKNKKKLLEGFISIVASMLPLYSIIAFVIHSLK